MLLERRSRSHPLAGGQPNPSPRQLLDGLAV